MDASYLHSNLLYILLRKHGIPAVDSGGFKKLASVLKTNYGVHVSSNTIERLIGWRKDARKHYANTLNSLAICAGYQSYEQYVSLFRFKNHCRLDQLHAEPEGPFLLQYLITAILSEDIRFLDALSDYINRHAVSIDLYRGIGFSMLHALRKKQPSAKMIRYLTGNTIYVELFFETFVDIDFLHGYFGTSMIALAKNTKPTEARWVFAQCLAFRHERLTNKKSAYIRRGQLLTSIKTKTIDKWIELKQIFPAARWIMTMVEYYHLMGNEQQATQLFDYGLTQLKNGKADEAIIFISQLSDAGNLMPPERIADLSTAFLAIQQQVGFEMDSLFNAALNLTLLTRKKHGNLHDIKTYIQHNPLSFSTSSMQLAQKLKKCQRIR